MSALSSTAAFGTPATPPSNNAFAELDSGEFLNIMLTELTNQDPLQPNDTAAVLEQLSSLRNIESQVSLQEQLETMVMQNSISQASGMIGKVVEGLDLGNDRISGVVTSVRVVDGEAELELDSGKTLPIDRVTAITAAGDA